MNTVIKKTAIAAFLIGTFGIAASLEAYYMDLKTNTPDLTDLTRKDAAKAIYRTMRMAVTYQQTTGLQMTEEHALMLIQRNATAIVNNK